HSTANEERTLVRLTGSPGPSSVNVSTARTTKFLESGTCSVTASDKTWQRRLLTTTHVCRSTTGAVEGSNGLLPSFFSHCTSRSILPKNFPPGGHAFVAGSCFATPGRPATGTRLVAGWRCTTGATTARGFAATFGATSLGVVACAVVDGTVESVIDDVVVGCGKVTRLEEVLSPGVVLTAMDRFRAAILAPSLTAAIALKPVGHLLLVKRSNSALAWATICARRTAWTTSATVGVRPAGVASSAAGQSSTGATTSARGMPLSRAEATPTGIVPTGVTSTGATTPTGGMPTSTSGTISTDGTTSTGGEPTPVGRVPTEVTSSEVTPSISASSSTAIALRSSTTACSVAIRFRTQPHWSERQTSQ
ncbi:hypothetical protein GNI_051370, partial [Gregarina niphandrodes]